MSLEHTSHVGLGTLALVGSGEYLDVMNTTDAYLLETIGGASKARVALLPTASGLEMNGPANWNELGMKHFKALGVKDIRPTLIIDRAHAHEPGQLALLHDADFYYFSGGNPQHVTESLQGSPAWEIITVALKRGAVLAGCSAGAMAFGGYTVAVRQMIAGNKPSWVPALSLLPRVVVFPHFDRMAAFVGQDLFQSMLSTLPDGIIALGIDENTALVGIYAVDQRWQVMGAQTVKVFEKDKPQRTLHTGEEIVLK